MAGNTRGKIKEHLEGVHRNCDWQLHHISTILALVGDKNPEVKTSMETLARSIGVVDEFNQLIYSKI